jgi:hypothetical protein
MADHTSLIVRIRLPQTVRSELPFETVHARAGDHRAWMNQHGAIFVVGSDGRRFGIKPAEMELVDYPGVRWAHVPDMFAAMEALRKERDELRASVATRRKARRARGSEKST